MQIIVKQSYAHHNRSFSNWDSPKGVWVKNKDHYDRLCKEQGMVSYDKAQAECTGPKLKEYKLTKESEQLIKEARLRADSRGNVKLSDKMIDVLVKKGAVGKKVPDYMKLPAHYGKKGSFC